MILFIVGAVLVVHAATLVYVLLQAWVGAGAGIQVKELDVGFGPALLRSKIADVPLVIRLIPGGGFTKFKEPEDRENDRETSHENGSNGYFKDASPIVRMVIVVVGPLSQILLGLLMLGAPVLAGTSQLRVVPREESAVRPSAVGGLALANTPSTWPGQLHLFQETLLEFSIRLVTFQSLEGWGGYVGMFITSGLVGELSAWAWLTCMGAVVLLFGLWNLAPIPVFNGFHFLTFVYEALVGRPLPLGFLASAHYLGLLTFFILFIRSVWIDVRWLWETYIG